MPALRRDFDFGLGLANRHWNPVTAPGASKENVAFFRRALIFAFVIFVPLGLPKVAVTVWSLDIAAWQTPVPVQGPEKPAKSPGIAGLPRRIATRPCG